MCSQIRTLSVDIVSVFSSSYWGTCDTAAIPAKPLGQIIVAFSVYLLDTIFLCISYNGRNSHSCADHLRNFRPKYNQFIFLSSFPYFLLFLSPLFHQCLSFYIKLPSFKYLSFSNATFTTKVVPQRSSIIVFETSLIPMTFSCIFMSGFSLLCGPGFL